MRCSGVLNQLTNKCQHGQTAVLYLFELHLLQCACKMQAPVHQVTAVGVTQGLGSYVG